MKKTHGSEKKLLKKYWSKRNFTQTPEPASGSRSKLNSKKLSFVIQRHEARRLHYDLRLEAAGVYKSWAVPKGLPEQPGQKVLAIEVEDHPLSYGKFEGRIPPGNYGAGLVEIWDKGTYESLEKPIEEAYRKGKIHLRFKGKKAIGEWHLVKTHFSSEKPQWLLIKAHQSKIKIPVESKKKSLPKIERTVGLRELKSVKVKNWIEPMLALRTERLPRSQEWQYEVKFDGYRALAYLKKGKCEIYSRNQKQLTLTYPAVTKALEKINCQSAILDGELVAFDSQGRPSFQALQNASTHLIDIPVFYYIFDIISLNGKDFARMSLEKRQGKISDLIPKSELLLKESARFAYPPDALLKEVKKKGLEGLMAKQKGSLYESGKRTGSWLKYKFSNEQEFVIGGYTDPQGSRIYFGAIIIGYYEEEKLICVGKVGTGFDQINSRDLFNRFQKLITKKGPFSNLPLPASISPNWTPQQLKNYNWLKPTLVCQVKFNEWTKDSFLRQPVFLGLRIDKNAREVKREA